MKKRLLITLAMLCLSQAYGFHTRTNLHVIRLKMNRIQRRISRQKQSLREIEQFQLKSLNAAGVDSIEERLWAFDILSGDLIYARFVWNEIKSSDKQNQSAINALGRSVDSLSAVVEDLAITPLF
ncbi:MAG: hypothetical protein A2007_00175 [Verrucomicrobia bacterium GWC2_42_7]|nr:MAG: hypothetical protein A2007_00175 [Verrucomicrobia bacterium GWC2_42_7]